MIKVWKTRVEIGIDNTIEYDVKSYQVKTSITKCTKVLIKGLKFNISQKKMLVFPTGMQHNKTNLNMKLTKTCKQHNMYLV